jgi:hypothetical protein
MGAVINRADLENSENYFLSLPLVISYRCDLKLMLQGEKQTRADT